jgi:hypothetical protein
VNFCRIMRQDCTNIGLLPNESNQAIMCHSPRQAVFQATVDFSPSSSGPMSAETFFALNSNSQIQGVEYSINLIAL